MSSALATVCAWLHARLPATVAALRSNQQESQGAVAGAEPSSAPNATDSKEQSGSGLTSVVWEDPALASRAMTGGQLKDFMSEESTQWHEVSKSPPQSAMSSTRKQRRSLLPATSVVGSSNPSPSPSPSEVTISSNK